MSKPLVLFVDDDPHMRSAIARALRRDYSVEIAEDGSQAIERFERGERFDAILTELEMPIVSGDAIVKWLEQYEPALAGRVVILTGGTADTARREWLATFDQTRVLRKPCALPDLLAVLRVVIARTSSA